MHRSVQSFVFLAAFAGALGCGSVADEGEAGAEPSAGALELGTARFAVSIPARGTSATFDVASWNIEWFGDTSNGPSNETLQRNNARDVIAGADMDVWGVAEIVGAIQWSTLLGQLSGYSGLLANESSVVNGPQYYSDFNNKEQKVGLLYKSSLASVQDARIILTASDNDFAGRPPLQVTLRVTLNGLTEDVIVIVMHPKCCSDNDSWQRRKNAATALKTYLDNTHPTRKVWVIGDFNDDVDTSIASGNPSPYASFVNDAADYVFPTKALSDAGIASTVGFPDTIDHHLNSNESNALYVPGSVEAYRVDQFITNYGTTTSDHYPVLSRYNWSGGDPGGGGTADVIINEVCANEPGSDTAGEFIELLNAGSGTANIGGWKLSDGTQVRHTFASGTTLQAGKAIVVFAGSAGIPGGLTNAVVASTGGLSLANGGDTVTLADASGVSIDGLTYTSSMVNADGVSLNLSPDGSPTGSFVKHDTISSLSRSAGVRANGNAW